MAGQRLGSRSYYAYTSDSGTIYSVLLDDDIATAGGLVADDTNPNKPNRFQMRGVYVEAITAGEKARKFIPCAADSTLYNTDTTTSVTIDGEAFDTTGRRGETLSFPRNT